MAPNTPHAPMVYGYANTISAFHLSRCLPLAREQNKTARAEQGDKAAEKRTAELGEGVAPDCPHGERPSGSLSFARGARIRSKGFRDQY